MSSKQTKSNDQRRQFWQMVIETWQDSGMPISKDQSGDNQDHQQPGQASGHTENPGHISRKGLAVISLGGRP